ncbi:unnamed protein product [Sympodiomycopsis kandeliae]
MTQAKKIKSEEPSSECGTPSVESHDNDADFKVSDADFSLDEGHDGKVDSKGENKKVGRKRKKVQANTAKQRSAWSTEEELSMLRAVGRLALENIPKIASAEGLEARAGSRGAKVNLKLRSLLKKLDQEYGGDGKWVMSYKVQKAASSKNT